MVSFIHEQRERLVAIGEVGLDYWAVKEEPERKIQKEIFAMFIAVVVRAISEIKGIEEKEVVGTVAENTHRLYGKL